MRVVTEDNFHEYFSPERQEVYWQRVDWILRDVLNSSPDLAKRYRKQLEEAPLEEQILALHDHPLNVALALAGVTSLNQHQRTTIEQAMKGWDEMRAEGDLPSVPKAPALQFERLFQITFFATAFCGALAIVVAIFYKPLDFKAGALLTALSSLFSAGVMSLLNFLFYRSKQIGSGNDRKSE